MARMTPSEATAVNVMFGFLAGLERDVPHEVARALETLASRAHNRLQAGVDEHSVREQWPDAFTSASASG